MELTRRDALAALVGAGVLGGGSAAALARDGFADDGAGTHGDDERVQDVVDALVATARVVYPAAVANVAPFVETYAGTKLDRHEAYVTGASGALETLDAEAQISFDGPYAALDTVECETVLRRVGAETAEPDPEGSAAERVRYYLVNEVLYALYASPTGGELVGIENPQGHPGGTASYRRGPR